MQELTEALSALQNMKLVTRASAKRDELTKAAAEARQKLANTAGCTAASVEALKQALKIAEDILANPNAALAQLTAALDALNGTSLVPETSGSQEQKPAESKGLQKGQKAVLGGMTYQVTDADKKEVTLVKGKNTKTVRIGKAVSLDGISCKITGIAGGAFKNDKNVKTVSVGANVKSIDKNAFAGCSALSAVTLGKNVKAIGKKAFYNCKKLKKVTLQGKAAPSVGKNAFGKTASGIRVQAKKLSKKARASLLNKLKKTGGMKGGAKIN